MLNDLLYGLRYLYAKTSKGYPAGEDQINEFVLDLLERSPGLAFGEIHGAYAFPRFLRDRMSEFADRGVRALFVEMVPRRKQSLLDEWQTNGNPKPLIDYFNSRHKANSSYQWQNYWEMLEAARVADIRVYGINTMPEDDNDGQINRMGISNAIWLNAIKRVIAHFQPGDKYIVFGGQGHFRYTCNGVQGVSYELGIPSVQMDYGKPLLVQQAVTPQEHLIRLPLGPDHISFFNGPVVKHRQISYPE